MRILALDDHRDNLTALQAVLRDALPGAEILTALRADRESRVRALEVGAEGFLSKPFDEVELVAQIRAMAKIRAANCLQRLRGEQLAALVAERTRELEQELTERRRTEPALRRREESYHSFVAHSREAIYCTEFDQPIDTTLPVEEQIDAIYRDGYLGECNQAMAAMYGLLSTQAFVGKRLADVHGGKDIPANRATFRRFILSDYRGVDSETEEVTPQGEKRFFLNSERSERPAGPGRSAAALSAHK